MISQILLQYGRKDSYRAATTPLVKHAPEKEKKGKKGEKKDKLEDLKQELEMVRRKKIIIIIIKCFVNSCIRIIYTL